MDKEKQSSSEQFAEKLAARLAPQLTEVFSTLIKETVIGLMKDEKIKQGKDK